MRNMCKEHIVNVRFERKISIFPQHVMKRHFVPHELIDLYYFGRQDHLRDQHLLLVRPSSPRINWVFWCTHHSIRTNTGPDPRNDFHPNTLRNLSTLPSNLVISKLIRLESISHFSPNSGPMFKLLFSKISLKTKTDLPTNSFNLFKKQYVTENKNFQH